MKKKKLTHGSLAITHDATIEEAMGAITDNQRGCVAVVRDQNIFEGVVSDGDIRRAMLQGATRLTPVTKIINMNATVITEDEARRGRAEEIFNTESSINILPVVDTKNTLVDVLIREPKKRKTL